MLPAMLGPHPEPSGTFLASFLWKSALSTPWRPPSRPSSAAPTTPPQSLGLLASEHTPNLLEASMQADALCPTPGRTCWKLREACRELGVPAGRPVSTCCYPGNVAPTSEASMLPPVTTVPTTSGPLGGIQKVGGLGSRRVHGG